MSTTPDPARGRPDQQRPAALDSSLAARTRRILRAVIATARYWGPLLAGFVCLFAVALVGPLVAWLLLFLAAALIFDGVTAMFQRAGSVGNLTDHRQ